MLLQGAQDIAGGALWNLQLTTEIGVRHPALALRHRLQNQQRALYRGGRTLDVTWHRTNRLAGCFPKWDSQNEIPKIGCAISEFMFNIIEHAELSVAQTR